MTETGGDLLPTFSEDLWTSHAQHRIPKCSSRAKGEIDRETKGWSEQGNTSKFHSEDVWSRDRERG